MKIVKWFEKHKTKTINIIIFIVVIMISLLIMLFLYQSNIETQIQCVEAHTNCY